MKLLLGIGGAGIAAGGLYAGGAFQGGEVYDLPLAEVRTELVAMPLPTGLVQASGASDAAAVTVDASERRVEWRVSLGGSEVSRFTALLKSEGGDRTRVTVEHSAPGPASVTGRLTSTRFLSSYAEATFAEQVDSQLEGRAYDEGRAMQAFAEHVRDNPEDVRELGNAVNGIFVEVANQARDTANANAGYSPASVQQSMRAATKPSVNLDGNH